MVRKANFSSRHGWNSAPSMKTILFSSQCFSVMPTGFIHSELPIGYDFLSAVVRTSKNLRPGHKSSGPIGQTKGSPQALDKGRKVAKLVNMVVENGLSGKGIQQAA